MAQNAYWMSEWIDEERRQTAKPPPPASDFIMPIKSKSCTQDLSTILEDPTSPDSVATPGLLDAVPPDLTLDLTSLETSQRKDARRFHVNLLVILLLVIWSMPLALLMHFEDSQGPASTPPPSNPTVNAALAPWMWPARLPRNATTAMAGLRLAWRPWRGALIAKPELDKHWSKLVLAMRDGELFAQADHDPDVMLMHMDRTYHLSARRASENPDPKASDHDPQADMMHLRLDSSLHLSF